MLYGNWLHRFQNRNVFMTKIQWASLFLMLTILEFAIFGAKIQTNVDPKEKWVQKKGKRVSQQRL